MIKSTRKFKIWAEVRDSEITIELPESLTDAQCEEECAIALETLIGNGDTGWVEVEDGDDC